MAKRTNQNVVERDTGIQMPIPSQTSEESSNRKSQASSKRKRTPAGKNVNKSDIKKMNASQQKKKQTGKKQQVSAVVNEKSPKQGIKMKREVWFVVAFGLMIFMTLSNFGVCGVVGNAVSDFFFGIFGCVQYVMPVAFFSAVVILMINQYSLMSVKKTAAGFVALMMVSAFTQVISNNDNLTIMDLMSVAIRNHFSGGIIGGGFGFYMEKWFSKFGAIIIIMCCVVLSGIVLTQKSMVEFFREMILSIKNSWEERHSTYPYDIEYEEIPEEPLIPDDIIDLDFEAEEEFARSKKARRPMKKKAKVDNIVMQPEPEILNPLEAQPIQAVPEEAEEQLEETVSVRSKIREKHKIKKEKKAAKQRASQCDELLRDLEEEQPADYEVENMPVYEEEYEEMSPIFTHNEDIFRKNSVKELHANDFPLVDDGGDRQRAKPKRQLRQVDFSASMEDDFVQERQEKPKKRVGQRSEEKKAAPKAKKEKRQEAKSVTDFYEVEQADGDDYIFPPISLLAQNKSRVSADFDRQLKDTARLLQETLASFGVNVKITDISCGPSVTRYEMVPEQGTKVSRIVNLTDDIKLNLAAADIRIEAPIPGKAAIGIEVPNKESMMVHFRDLIESNTFRGFKSKMAFAVGKDIAGKTVVSDLAKMPHLLIAGATGSGKSVCINTLVMSILYKAKPSEVKLIMIDPKMVELSVYNGIPHLLIPVVTDPKKASGALNWAVAEMTDRYAKFTQYGVRNIEGYNQKITDLEKLGEIEVGSVDRMPKIVIIVDELADLMMVAPGEVEDAIVRLSQLARAAGIHLVIATQRPSVNVITGLIKANVPSRIAFSVSSGVDSRTIIDMNGAEKLLGKGDMLFYPTGYQKPVRVQGAFVSDQEVSDVVEFLKNNEEIAIYDENITRNIESSMKSKAASSERDEYFEAAARFFIEKDKATIGMMQRMFKIGFNRAARIMDQLSEAGIVGPEEGTKPRKVLMSEEQLEQYFEEYL